ncbi:SdrD B-like domain-containing protein [Paracoccus sp. DMF]|uniref:DUF7507 domain-containing protein n=1 Tax=Paracoccus sp. DMF TaxID=400837 RepID=UPI0021E39B34|nr:SdrD B-like domain-containing protein [Paracoccus sp. DMF]MCV2446176.1 hypothetical protein [Paracoccus sp. DMF]
MFRIFTHHGFPFHRALFRHLASILLGCWLLAFQSQAAVAQSVDWVVNIDDSGSDPSPAGGLVDYTIRIANDGLSPAPATTLGLDVPSGAVLEATTGAIAGCAPLPATGPQRVSCLVPALAADAHASLTAQLRTSTQGMIGFTASVPTGMAGAIDGQPGNNAVTENTSLTAGADVALTLSGPDNAPSGAVVTYSFVARNNGPDPVGNLTLGFAVPAGLANIVPPPSAGCMLAAGTYSCPIAGPVAAGMTVTRSFQAQVVRASGLTVTPAASIGGGSVPDPVPANNSTQKTTGIAPGSDLSISKSRAPGGVILMGQQVTFTLTPRYSGDSPQGITVTDTLPAHYSLVSYNAPGWNVTTSGQTVTATRAAGSGTGANLALGPITIVARADAAGNVSNTAQIVSATPEDPNPANNGASDGGVTIQAPQVDLRANKSGPSPALYVVGQSYNFTISTSNIGNAAFVGRLRMTDQLPAGLRVTHAAPNGWSCTALPVTGPAPLSCQRDYSSAAPLGVNGTTPAVTLTAEATQAGAQPNGLTVGSPDLPDEPNTGNNSTTYAGSAVLAANSADLRVIKTANLAAVASGDPILFTVEIVNDGPATATGVTVTDALTGLLNSNVGPNHGFAGHTALPGSASAPSCSTGSNGSGRTASCTIATLPVCTAGSDCPRIVFAVRPGGNAGPRTNTASALSADTPDPVPGNNSGSTGYAVTARADVSVSKTATPATPAVGQPFDYEITARNLNSGLSQAENVTITDTLPAGLTFISATPDSGSCAVKPAANTAIGPGNDTVSCNLGTIPVNAQRTVTIRMRPDLGAQGGSVTNTVSVATSSPETGTGNNSFSLNTTIADPQINLLVNMTDSVDPLPVGTDAVYRITVTNSGPLAATGVAVTNDLPGALAYAGHDLPGDGTCGTVPAAGVPGGQLACSFPLLAAGDSRVLEVTARGLAKGVALNRVEVASAETRAGFEANLLDNVATQPTTLRTRADVEMVSNTSDPATVNLRDPFDFRIELRNIAGAGLAEADDVVVTGNLPAGVELTGTPTVAIVSGAASLSSCTGVAGATIFTCNLGTLSAGADLRITAPSRVISVAATGQVFTNTAGIATSSFEANTANNARSGTVTVNASSLTGRVFRDFDNDAAAHGGDAGIGGLAVTLSGTAFDMTPVHRTATTAPDGSYVFAGLPAGHYSVSHAAIGEADLQDGTTTAGSAGGTATASTISGIALPAATPATGYLFPKVPRARIGIAKSLAGGLTIHADGSFTAGFGLIVQNPSLEALEQIEVTDPLAGAAPAFGSFAALASPATDPLAPGSYTIVAAPSGSCGGANGGFDGASNDVVASGFSLAAGAQCSLGFRIRVRPLGPLPPVQASGGHYENRAQAEGTGALSGQTRASNPALADGSNNGTTVQPGVVSPTPLTPVFAPSIALVQTADASALNTPPAKGDRLTYSLTVTNTGDVTLKNVAVAAPGLGAVAGSPIAALAPGASQALTAVHELTQADLDSGEVVNTATAEGEAPDGSTVADVSGTGPSNDDPTVVPLTAAPSLALVKSADVSALSLPAMRGDRISYDLTVTNTGNVTLTDVTVTDPMLGAIPGSPLAVLAPGASRTLNADHELTQADLDRGRIENTAFAAAKAPDGSTVDDVSGTDATNDDPTRTNLAARPAIALVKTADASALSSPAAVGEQIAYSLTVTNTGNVTLTNVTVADPMLGAIAGSPVAVLAPGASRVLRADYELTQADLDAAEVVNTATAEGEAPGGGRVTDVSGTDATNDDPTVVALRGRPAIALIKLADASSISTPAAIGDPITYSFTVANTGSVVLNDIALTDTMPGVELTGGPIAALAPGAVDSTSFTATYRLTQADIDAGEVRNSATVTGSADSGELASDISGTTAGDDDPTVVPIAPAAGVRLVKSLAGIEDTNGNGIQDVGDVVRFGFRIGNTGNVALQVESIEDATAIVSGGSITIAAGMSDGGSFTASHVLTQADLDRGHVQNTAVVAGTAVRGDGSPIPGPGGAPLRISASSDAGTDPEGRAVPDPEATETRDGAGQTDGDPGNDPTVVRLARTAAVALIKRYAGFADANGNGVEDAGDTLNFAFAVANTGNVALRIATIDDPAATVSGGPVILAPGETDSTTFAAAWLLSDQDMRRGHVQNAARVTGHAVTTQGVPIRDGRGLLSVTDVSDSGTDPEGAALDDPQAVETPDGEGGTDSDPANDPTVVKLGRPEVLLKISVVETPDRNGNGIFDAGDQIVYAFAVTNTGNVPLEDVTIDPGSLSLDMPGFSCRPVRLSVAGTAVLTCAGNRYTVTAEDARQGQINLAATATGRSVAGVRAVSEDAVVSPTMRAGGLTLTNSADRGTAVVGDLVGYVLELANDAAGITTTTDLVDTLPAGFSYRSGSATVGRARVEPEIRGNRLLWHGLTLAAGETLRVRIEALVGGGVRPGSHASRAQAFSPATGRPVTPEATATIRVEVDAVLACATVIGRVFDDLDHDGYRNARPGEEGAEQGLPGVRLVAPNGLAVTTDRHGRFSLPCAALPRDIGANFMLKLDERTLPLGYRPTSENPRVVRLTPGMLTKMNFGASLSRVARVDLSARAFSGDDPRPELQDGLRRLVAEIAARPSVLRLSYRLGPGERRGDARVRLRRVEAALRRLWPTNGRFAPHIETVVETRPVGR